jgi:MoxR-like ATPase
MAKYETPNEPSPDIFYNVDCLHQALNDSGYICSHDFTSKVMTSIHTKPIRGAFLYGMAGTGKSYLPMVLAKVLDRQLFVHQCTQGTREEDLLVKTMPSENTISGVKIGHGKLFQAAIESRKRPVMLMLDEWDKTRPSADGFFLDFLQYGRLSVPGGDAVLARSPSSHFDR